LTCKSTYRGGRANHGRRFHVRAALAGIALALGGCVTLTSEPRALESRPDGTIAVEQLACSGDIDARLPRRAANRGLDPLSIRIVTWNIHKQADAGWQRDLRAFSAGHDLVLLQESVLDTALREIIEDAGLRFAMASSFLRDGADIGVLTAARVPPLASCTQRIVEPLLRIPKSAVISWFPLHGDPRTLVVVNVHAINFSLSLDAYRAQLAAIGDVLAQHPGPLVVAGDLNTWTDARHAAVHALAARLALTEVRFTHDRRSIFLGHQLDHIYTRGLALVASSTSEVRSSDHNPVAATLRVEPPRTSLARPALQRSAFETTLSHASVSVLTSRRVRSTPSCAAGTTSLNPPLASRATSMISVSLSDARRTHGSSALERMNPSSAALTLCATAPPPTAASPMS
jgi:endonuclease/exonuclease/phosphatase (EEP) superfamily protein YafD